MSQNWIKDLVEQNAARDARRRAIALLALEGANPTDAELDAYRPGQRIDSLRGTTGASPTADPAGAVADLQAEMRNEELQRAADQSAPDVAGMRRNLAFKDAGLDENNLATARYHGALAAEQESRRKVIEEALSAPNANPLLRVDIANKKDVFKPTLVKVRQANGKDVYMNQTPTLGGTYTFEPALDDAGNPLQAAPSATAAGGGPTSLQKDAAFMSRVLGIPLADAVQQLRTLKGKAPEEAWAATVRQVAQMSYGRYARDPKKLYEKSSEIWQVARPGESVPELDPTVFGAIAAQAGATAPAAPAPSKAPVTAAGLEPTAINPKTGQRLVYRNGQWQPVK